MAGSSQLQARLNPAPAPRSFDSNQFDVKMDQVAKDSNAGEQVDFRSLMQNSNTETARERSAKKSGDLSAAKTDEEFRKMLSDRINPTRAPKNQMDKDDFLKLFIAQMQNQDPLNPQDNTQMAAQLAQFNGLEQMMNVNKTLENLVKSQSMDRALGMINYIGKEVSLNTGALKFDGKNVTKAVFRNESPISEAKLEVRDGSGAVVAQQPLGNLMAGEHPVSFDGKGKDGKTINPGVYSFSVIAKGMEGNDVTVPITTKVKISGLDIKEDGGALFTEIGKVKVTDIAAVGAPGFSDAMVSSEKKNSDTIKEVGENVKAGTENTAVKAEDNAEKTQKTSEIPIQVKQAIEDEMKNAASPTAERKEIEVKPEKTADKAPAPAEPIARNDTGDKLNPIRRDFEIPVNRQENKL